MCVYYDFVCWEQIRNAALALSSCLSRQSSIMRATCVLCARVDNNSTHSLRREEIACCDVRAKEKKKESRKTKTKKKKKKKQGTGSNFQQSTSHLLHVLLMRRKTSEKKRGIGRSLGLLLLLYYYYHYYYYYSGGSQQQLLLITLPFLPEATTFLLLLLLLLLLLWFSNIFIRSFLSLLSNFGSSSIN